MKKQKSGVFIPILALLIIAAGIIFAIYKHFETQAKLKPAIEQRKAIETKIKDTEFKMDSSLNHLQEKSNSAATLSNNIKTKIQNEKSEINTVSDTTYDAMCKHVAEFRPE